MRYVNKRRVAPYELQPNDRMAVKVVAVIGSADRGDGKPYDWAAYQGPSDWSDDRVAKEGMKLMREAAEYLFPVMTRTGAQYRG